MYDLKVLQRFDKSVKTKSEKVFGANSYVCRSYRENLEWVGGGGGECGFFDPSAILLRSVHLTKRSAALDSENCDAVSYVKDTSKCCIVSEMVNNCFGNQIFLFK